MDRGVAGSMPAGPSNRGPVAQWQSTRYVKLIRSLKRTDVPMVRSETMF